MKYVQIKINWCLIIRMRWTVFARLKYDWRFICIHCIRLHTCTCMQCTICSMTIYTVGLLCEMDISLVLDWRACVGLPLVLPVSLKFPWAISSLFINFIFPSQSQGFDAKTVNELVFASNPCEASMQRPKLLFFCRYIEVRCINIMICACHKQGSSRIFHTTGSRIETN
jgi:hypothetical protein